MITDKRRYRAARFSNIERLCREIAAVEDVIVVHGAGSFGHILVRKSGLGNGVRRPEQVSIASRVMEDVRGLNLLVLRGLRRAGIRPVSLPPSAFVRFSDGVLHDMDLTLFLSYLGLGMTPVTFGDMVPDDRRGLSICSGDDLMLELSKRLRPGRVIFAADVDGVFAADPKRVKNAEFLKAVFRVSVDSIDFSMQNDTDVTGGLRSKLEKMIEISSYSGECLVLNGNVKGRLRDALRGKNVVATRVKGE